VRHLQAGVAHFTGVCSLHPGSHADLPGERGLLPRAVAQRSRVSGYLPGAGGLLSMVADLLPRV